MKILFEFKNKLFIIYSLVFMVLVVAMLVVFYQYTAVSINKSSNELLLQTQEKISYKLDSIIEGMNTTTLQVVTNRDIHDILLKSSQDRLQQNYFDYNYKSQVSNILNSINSPLMTNARISIFDENYNYLTVGYLSTRESFLFSEEHEKYENLSSLEEPENDVVIVPTHLDNWAQRKPEKVFSFIRKIPYIDSVRRYLAYIEVMQPYSMIEAAIVAETDPSITVTILDRDNNLVYPYNQLTLEERDYYIGLKDSSSNQSIRPWDSKKEIVSSSTSEYSDWTIILTQSENDYLATLTMFRKLLLAYSGLFYIFMMIVLFNITKRVTSPITKLRRQVEQMSDAKGHLEFDGSKSTGEIIMLTDAFNQTINRLNTSMEETVLANQNQVNAHILAMQSQMNPHFMFNTLMGISGIAEEEDNIRIVDICDKLASMLRYISSFKEAEVPLRDEVKYATDYLELMKIRYEDFLSYDIVIDETVYDFPLTKLILQPMVENCFAHGFKNIQPPYYVKIDILVEDDFIHIQVMDNGSGISPEDILQFQDKIKAYKEQNIAEYINNSELGGLGMVNSYLRMRLKYGNKVDMIIANNINGGSQVLIKVPMNKAEGEKQNAI